MAYKRAILSNQRTLVLNILLPSLTEGTSFLSFDNARFTMRGRMCLRDGRCIQSFEVFFGIFYHSHTKNSGVETHEKVLLYVFVHVFFVGMGKQNLNNVCLF